MTINPDRDFPIKFLLIEPPPPPPAGADDVPDALVTVAPASLTLHAAIHYQLHYSITPVSAAWETSSCPLNTRSNCWGILKSVSSCFVCLTSSLYTVSGPYGTDADSRS
ncbi:hypothetical protein BCR44DRAFT_1280674 [Catenaria anguillulae PL171]|uniref:Uncharacterized protein n=1 Tax=Catenaria anguillulae PL171 TaxID=765915 RepID=A0A1Y2HXM7_9FUNG|nr:hypothetical protein BCR44DRAFT_1280674 [Catenaria anguillulae PL171]